MASRKRARGKAKALPRVVPQPIVLLYSPRAPTDAEVAESRRRAEQWSQTGRESAVVLFRQVFGAAAEKLQDEVSEFTIGGPLWGSDQHLVDRRTAGLFRDIMRRLQGLVLSTLGYHSRHVRGPRMTPDRARALLESALVELSRTDVTTGNRFVDLVSIVELIEKDIRRIGRHKTTRGGADGTVGGAGGVPIEMFALARRWPLLAAVDPVAFTRDEWLADDDFERRLTKIFARNRKNKSAMRTAAELAILCGAFAHDHRFRVGENETPDVAITRAAAALGKARDNLNAKTKPAPQPKTRPKKRP